MSITTWGWGSRQGLVTLGGWGGPSRGKWIVTGLYPEIRDSLELLPLLMESKGLTPLIAGAEDDEKIPDIESAEELNPAITSSKELKPEIE